MRRPTILSFAAIRHLLPFSRPAPRERRFPALIVGAMIVGAMILGSVGVVAPLGTAAQSAAAAVAGCPEPAAGAVHRIPVANCGGPDWFTKPSDLARIHGKPWDSRRTRRESTVFRDRRWRRLAHVHHGAPEAAPRLDDGVIGHARSPDIVHWELGPPLSLPTGFGQIEVPQARMVRGRPTLVFTCHTDEQTDRRKAQSGCTAPGRCPAILWSGPGISAGPDLCGRA